MPQFCFGQCGYDLYAEIHQTYGNQLMHGLFMPFVVYGTFIGIPALFNIYPMSSNIMQIGIYMSYMLYYLTFDPVGAVFSLILYYPALIASLRYDYTPQMRWLNVAKGLAWILGAVAIQEGIGHTLFEHTNSDIWQLPNSILIAPIFGARCFFHRP